MIEIQGLAGIAGGDVTSAGTLTAGLPPAAASLLEALRLCLPSLPPIALAFGERIYPGPLPQRADLPALTYTVIAEREQYSHSGASGLHYTRCEFSCWARTYTEASAGAKALKTALGALRVAMPDYTLGPCFLISHVDLREPDQNWFRAAVDFGIYNCG